MIKKRDKDGNIQLGIPQAKEDKPHDTYHLTVAGLPVGFDDTVAINAAIRDLSTQGKLDKMKISDGNYTFEQLYTRITALEAQTPINEVINIRDEIKEVKKPNQEMI